MISTGMGTSIACMVPTEATSGSMRTGVPAQHPDLDVGGRKLALVTGTSLKVGLPEGATVAKVDFTVLQGARPRPVPGDFNHDGRSDLIVGDTYGKVRYYENRGTNADPVFAEPVLVDDRKSRVFVTSLDFNGDGWPDLAVLKGKVFLFVNKAISGACNFLPPQELALPPGIGYILSLASARLEPRWRRGLALQHLRGMFLLCRTLVPEPWLSAGPSGPGRGAIGLENTKSEI